MKVPQRPRLMWSDFGEIVHDGEFFIHNRRELSDGYLNLPHLVLPILQFLDGNHSLDEACQAYKNRCGMNFPRDVLMKLVEMIDQLCLFDSPRRDEAIARFVQQTVRPSSLAGRSYPDDAEELRQFLSELFNHPRGAGHPTFSTSNRAEKLRGILCPHIDFPRGGPTFTWSYKALAEQSHATVFVIIGTAHYSMEKFILTRKDFATPLGVAHTHQGFVDRITADYGTEVFADEVAHKPEHSIEFQVVFLQYLLQGKRDFRIVPLLVGSFHESVEENSEPMARPEIARMVAALRSAEAESGEEVCYISSGDLAHIGEKFGDSWIIDEARGQWCQEADEQLLAHMATGTARSLFDCVAAEKDERRICGYPPTYTMMQIMGNTRGELLRYDQYRDPREIVSFASMAFYQ